MAEQRPSLAREIGIAALDYRHALRLRAGILRERRAPAAWTAGSGRPVVLLPGVFETWHYLRPLGARLAAAGHPVHALPELGFTTAPIPELAERAGAAIARLGLRRVVLVAHSKGGLVGKQLMLRHDPEGRIDSLVAIAAPFLGSSRSAWMPGRALRAFQPGDPVVRALAAETAVDARIVSIRPELDPHIPETSRLAGAADVVIPSRGHFGVLLRPDTAEAVLAALAEATVPSERPGGGAA